MVIQSFLRREFGLFKVIWNTSLDVRLFARCAIQYMGNLPSMHELVVVLGIGLSSQIDRVPQTS